MDKTCSDCQSKDREGNTVVCTDVHLCTKHGAVDDLRWMASVIYLHYYNRTDLDPVQQKHLELAIRNGAPFGAAAALNSVEGKATE
jgi:hypothetical protein